MEQCTGYSDIFLHRFVSLRRPIQSTKQHHGTCYVQSSFYPMQRKSSLKLTDFNLGSPSFYAAPSLSASRVTEKYKSHCWFHGSFQVSYALRWFCTHFAGSIRPVLDPYALSRSKTPANGRLSKNRLMIMPMSTLSIEDLKYSLLQLWIGVQVRGVFSISAILGLIV
jgi:hypothetical protein